LCNEFGLVMPPCPAKPGRQAFYKKRTKIYLFTESYISVDLHFCIVAMAMGVGAF